MSSIRICLFTLLTFVSSTACKTSRSDSQAKAIYQDGLSAADADGRALGALLASSNRVTVVDCVLMKAYQSLRQSTFQMSEQQIERVIAETNGCKPLFITRAKRIRFLTLAESKLFSRQVARVMGASDTTGQSDNPLGYWFNTMIPNQVFNDKEVGYWLNPIIVDNTVKDFVETFYTYGWDR
jgi:hypothetical protein